MAIDNSYLLSLFGVSTTVGTTTTTTAGASTKAQPTAPWDTSVTAPAASDLVRAALGGRRIIDESAVSVSDPSASADYKKLFTLYAALETLTALANRAATTGVTSSEKALIEKRFASGLAEVSAYLSTLSMDSLRLVQGVSSTTSKTTAAIQRDSAQSLTGVIHEGSPDQAVAAFQGDVRFSISVKRLDETITVNIDLSDMGDETRSLNNVVAHINETLEATGVETRIGREQLASEPRTIQVGDRTVSLPDGPDQWALIIRGSSVETVSFSAPETTNAVYITQTLASGAEELLKFNAEGGGAIGIGETNWVEGRLSQTSLPEGVETVRASAVAPDGSLWMLVDLTAGLDSQPIKGEQDVALMKFDSAGRLVLTRTLGAADSASGYALAVDDNGNVAVAGSVTGGLAVTGSTGALTGQLNGADADTVDSFVTMFDANGSELWTQRRGATAADEATSVAFGPNGTVIVGGRSQSSMPGAASLGGWDAYVQTFSQSQAYPTASTLGTAVDVVQFGGAGDDRTAAIAVSGSDLYTASVENGRAVLRHYTIGEQGQLTLSNSRDLGVLSGDIAGIAIDGERVIVAGTTNNGALDAGAATTAHSGGTDAFVASVDASLEPSASDRLTYLGGAGNDTVSDFKVHDGEIWMTGRLDQPLSAKPEDPISAYLSRIDPLTGTIEQTQSWTGAGGQADPSTIAVAPGGSSILDRLGLPQGEIVQSASKKLVDGTSLRVGDQFVVTTDAGGSRTVTIEAKDTLQSLARKIEQASLMQLKVTVLSEGGSVTGLEADGETRATTGGVQRLSISAASGRTGATLTSGASGRDALAGIGLSAGFVGSSSDASGLETFGLDLYSLMKLNTAEAIAGAGEALQAAMKVLRDAYRSLAPSTPSSASYGEVPAYLTNQIANYQAALARLTGG